MEDPDQLPEESYEQEDIMEELTQGIGDELLEDILGTDSSKDLAETNPQELITQLHSRIKTLERRLSQPEEKSSSGEGQFDGALKKYHRIMDRGREMAKEKLEQRRDDNTVYLTLSTVVRRTEDMDIEYGVKGKIKMKRQIGTPSPKDFEDLSILKVPGSIKERLHEKEES